MRIFVSMTSHPKRIKYVDTVVSGLLNQTRKPDEIHLWLAKPEFPNLENDLPTKLNAFVQSGTIILHWLNKNTYVHKRHEIFNYTNDDDLVFFFDDDIVYPFTIIDDVVNESLKRNNDYIINYNRFHKHNYRGKHIRYTGLANNPNELYIMWCGHSMIPSKLYPKFLLSDEYKEKRDVLSPISEECWLQPFLVLLDVPITCMNFKWGKEIEPNLKKSGLCSWYYKRDENRLSYKDRCLYNVLQEYPFIYDKYKRLFNYDSECSSPNITRKIDL